MSNKERMMELKNQIALNTFVREKWEEIPERIEVKYKNLKAWGFDLAKILKGGQETFQAYEEQTRNPGDSYEQDGQQVEIKEIIENAPPNSKLIIYVTLEERRGVIKAYLQTEKGDEVLLFSTSAGELLLQYFRRKKLMHLIDAFQSSGLTTEFIRKRGSEGKAYDFDSLPPKMRRILREAGDIVRKHTKTGRFSLAYFGENKDKEDRYIATFLLPTIYLFDIDIAEQIDKLFASLT